MKRLSPQILAFIIVLLFVTSCKKDKKDCSLTDANFAGSYKISKVTYKLTPSSPEQDGSSLVDACDLDNVTTFNTNHTYTYSDAGTKCDPADDGNGTWSLSGTTLTTDADSDSISNFSCSGFSLSTKDVIQDSDRVTITFKKQ